MSVAFRRESDEEHLEPKFEIPIPAGPNLVTARGLALIAERIAELEAGLESTADPAALAAIQRDLRYWQTRQVTAERPPAPFGDKVEFDTRVSVLLNGKPKTFQIVGDDEADPSAGLLSFNAPLSRAMLGAEAGEVLAFGGLEGAIEVLAIELAES
ncbi:MAG: nucleoside-diphosphate kinase [Sphingomonadales bacterium 32-68-7]|nr:MAG: nucleoside-diphosphate kinase [Sphingomonadales bacterium 12-68-11]OYX09455.1 MAG: nucleoside-diphosphate kinase [Sphingomonadales bacterium 32-68-7]